MGQLAEEFFRILGIMFLTQFPDLQWLKKQAEHAFESRKSWTGSELPHRGWPTVLLNVATTHTLRDNIRGPLSIFTNLSGVSFVEVGKRRVKVGEDFFFITNHDQYYTLETGNHQTETFNIHFGEFFADQVFAALAHPEKILDQPVFSPPRERMEFHNKLYQRTDAFTSIIRALQRNPDDPMFTDEKLAELMLILIRNRDDLNRIACSIPVVRHTTRTEILKRLLAATDYIYSHYHTDFSLDMLAAECCLSKFHFLRLFKLAFNKTPHQFLNEVRVERAKSLLKNRNFEIHRISPMVGMKDTTSFSRMFYKHTGVYPSVYRQAV